MGHEDDESGNAGKCAENVLNALEDLDMDERNRLLDLVPEPLRDALAAFFALE